MYYSSVYKIFLVVKRGVRANPSNPPCLRAWCVCTCVCVRTCVSARACVRACMSEFMPVCTCMHVCKSAPSSLTPCNLSLSFALPVFLSSGGLPNVQHAMLLVNTKLLTICGRFANMRALNLLFCSTNKKAPVCCYSNNVLCLELSVIL